jgi:hypothetical protein
MYLGRQVRPTESVNPVNGLPQNGENAHNTGFLRKERASRGAARGLPFGGEKVGAAGSESPFVSSAQAFG